MIPLEPCEGWTQGDTWRSVACRRLGWPVLARGAGGGGLEGEVHVLLATMRTLRGG